MSDKAKERIQALGNQLSPSSSNATSTSTSESPLPPIPKVAGKSTGPRVEGKVVIITGANSPQGIGRAAAHQFAENGARAVYVCDLDATHLDSHRRELASLFPGVEVHARQLDAADEAGVRDVVADAVARYGRLDVFFANAGIVGPLRVFTEFSKEEFLKVLDVNVTSVFLAAKYAAPAMQKTTTSSSTPASASASASAKPHPGGSIIATASVAGLRSNAGTTPYAASKAAVVSVAQTAAYQLAGTGVRVNAICPGLVETGMTAPTFAAARARGTAHRIGQLNPARRAGCADEVARVALFLGSDEASYVNGQAWAVDGGLSAGHPYVPGKMA